MQVDSYDGSHTRDSTTTLVHVFLHVAVVAFDYAPKVSALDLCPVVCINVTLCTSHARQT